MIYKIFLGLGGLGLVSHILLKYGGQGLKAALIWVMGKYPALRKFIAEHGPDIIILAQSLEKGFEEAVEDAENKEKPSPRSTDV